jgi:hypothetical protein
MPVKKKAASKRANATPVEEHEETRSSKRRKM